MIYSRGPQKNENTKVQVLYNRNMKIIPNTCSLTRPKLILP